MPLVQPEQIDMTEVRSALRAILQSGARLYMHFARETLATFGAAGGMTVRDHLRRYGQWRGTEMREAHNALGHEINMETLNRCWDSASVFIVKDDVESAGRFTPTDVVYDVHVCPAAEAWKAEDFHQWGHVYCDEFHQSCASTYHPDGNVVIPINMMKGDDHCHFRWVMPGTAREIDICPPSPLGLKLAQYYQAETPERGAYDALVRTSRLIGGRYWTMTEALFANHPEAEAEAVIRRFVRRWAAQRGQFLRDAHEIAGTPRAPASLLHDLDLAPIYTWELSEASQPDGTYGVAIAWTPLDDAWADLSADRVARIFWEESLPVLVEHYNPDLRLELTRLRWRGDDQSALTIARRV